MNTDISSFNQWIEAWDHFYDKEKELVDLDPNAALVSSVSSDGKPNARVILIKDVSQEGFTFYTNYESQKGKEIKRPDHWGGIIIMPSRVEVWKSRDDYKTRLHDRIVFTQSNDAWLKTILYP